MGRVVIPGVVEIKGNLYFRRRVTMPDGTRKAQLRRLPALTDPGFAAALELARGGTPAKRGQPQPGTFSALCHAFRSSLPLRRNRRGDPLSPATLRNYRTYADRIERDGGDWLIRSLTAKDVEEMQEGMADRPGVANNYLAVLQDMMSLACRKGWADHNPVREVKPLPLGEHEPWPDTVVTAFLAESTPMTRLALVTYLCSGQRGGDIIRMRRNWHDGRIMQLRQQKTGKLVAVPMHPLWTAEIAKVEPRAVTILYDRSGRPFQSLETLRERIKDVLAKPSVLAAIEVAIDNEDLPPGATLSPHGLRKNAACYLLEAGANEEEIGIITGMSPDTVRHYTKRVRALRIAERIAPRLAWANSTALPGQTKNGAPK